MEQNETHAYSLPVECHYRQSNYAFENGPSGESTISEFIVSLSNFKSPEKKGPLAYFHFPSAKTLTAKLFFCWAWAPGTSAL